MSDSRPNATERQKRAFGLLLRRLSENAGLSQEQNELRDRLYQLASAAQFDQAFDINHQLLLEIGEAHSAAEGAAEGTVQGDEQHLAEPPARFLSRLFKRRQITGPDIPAIVQSRERQLTTLALDRAVLLGMSGQPGEASGLLDKLMDARGDDPGNHIAEDIFEAALGLADLSGSDERRRQILRARMAFYFDLALEFGDDEKLNTALQAAEAMHCDLAGLDDVNDQPDAIWTNANMMRLFGQRHERTELLRGASDLLTRAAQILRKSGKIQNSYDMILEQLDTEVALASLMGDTAELSSISNRLRDIVDLPDTMVTTETRGQARYALGSCLAKQADIDGKIVTLRKSFGYFESAAKQFADIGMEARELKSLRDLAMAKLTAAELLALNTDSVDTDLILAKRYNAEAELLQQQLSARLG